MASAPQHNKDQAMHACTSAVGKSAKFEHGLNVCSKILLKLSPLALLRSTEPCEQRAKLLDKVFALAAVAPDPAP